MQCLVPRTNNYKQWKTQQQTEQSFIRLIKSKQYAIRA